MLCLFAKMKWSEKIEEENLCSIQKSVHHSLSIEIEINKLSDSIRFKTNNDKNLDIDIFKI